MDIDLLAKMVREAILDHDSVTLPGVGSFVAELVPSSFSDKGYTIHPPYRRLYFSPKQGTDAYLSDLYAAANQVDGDTASRILSEFLAEMKEVLKVRKTVVFPGLGRLRATRENHFFFVADEDLDIYPEGFGLGPVSLKTHEETPEEVATAVADLAGIMAEPVVEPKETPETPAPEEPAAEDVPAEEPAAEPASVVEPAPVVAPEPAPLAEPEPAPVAEPEPVAEPAPVAEPEPVVVPIPEVEPEPASSTEPEPALSTEPEPAPTPESEPAPTPEPAPVAEPKPEPEPVPGEKAPVAEPAAPVPEGRKEAFEQTQRLEYRDRKRRENLLKGLRIALIVMGALLALFLLFLLLARVMPQWLDPLLYSREELEILRY